ncbi:hypothetical protein Tco_0248270, partial [Tanacetum coccineum]
EQDVDPLIKLAKAAATAVAASAVPTGGSHEADIPPSSSIPSDEFVGGSAVLAGATTGPSADPSNKGKSPLLEEDPPVRERTFRQKEEDRLGEEAARRMCEEEQRYVVRGEAQFKPAREDSTSLALMPPILQSRPFILPTLEELLSYLHAAVESLQAVETLQWENTLTLGSSSNSGNHSTNSGNPLAFYSQQSSPKLDTSPSYQASRIK